jgi:hypothetical protein
MSYRDVYNINCHNYFNSSPGITHHVITRQEIPIPKLASVEVFDIIHSYGGLFLRVKHYLKACLG